MMISEVINSNIVPQYKYIRTLINKYHKNGDQSQSIFLMKTLEYLENIERLNIMARDAAEEYVR
jgi:hypothetical protein